MGRSESEMDVRLVAPAGKEMKTCQPAAESGACFQSGDLSQFTRGKLPAPCTTSGM